MSNIYIPGIGSQKIMNKISRYGLPVTEMWNYALDKDCNVISISDIKDFVSIERVLINGCVTKPADDGLYYFAPKPDGDVEVYINYTLNGEQSMGTHYSTEYNARLESTAIVNSVHDIESDDGDAHVDVYSLQGILLLHNATAGDVKNLPSGVYIINGQKISL